MIVFTIIHILAVTAEWKNEKLILTLYKTKETDPKETVDKSFGW